MGRFNAPVSIIHNPTATVERDVVPVRHTDQSVTVTVHFKPFTHMQTKITGYISLKEDCASKLLLIIKRL